MVGVPVIDGGPVTVEECYAFADTRPDEEKREFVEVGPTSDGARGLVHQLIIRNVVVALTILARELKARWAVLPESDRRAGDSDRRSLARTSKPYVR